MVCKPVRTPDVIIRDQTWNFSLFDCCWKGRCGHSAAALQQLLVQGFLFALQQNVYENQGKHQIITLYKVVDFIHFLYIFVFMCVYVYVHIYVCTQNHSTFLSVFSCFLLISRLKPWNKSNCVLGGNGVHLSCPTATANKMANGSGDR